MMRRFVRSAATAAVCIAVGATSAFAQQPDRSLTEGSRNLAMGHWAYEYIARLIDRGYLTNLDPLVQPYRRMDVALGLRALDPDTLQKPIAEWVRTLDREFQPELDRLTAKSYHHWGAIAEAGAVASSTRRLDPLRPVDTSGVWPNAHAGVWVQAGPFVAESRLAADGWWKHDPDGLDPGKGTRSNSRIARTDNAYIAVDLPFGRIELGRLARNWGTIGTTDLMISNNPFVYPQIALDAYAGRFGLHAFTGQLDQRLGAKRYISAHTVTYHVPHLSASLGEAVLYAAPNLNPSLSFLNPVEFLFFDQESPPNQNLTPNLVFNGQVWYRPGPFVVHAEGVVDDIDINPKTIVNGQKNADPPRIAFNFGLHLTSLAPWITPRLEYEQVAAFTYRTRTGQDAWTFLERGLGSGFDGYDRTQLLVDLYPPIPGLRLTPALELLRQGESSVDSLIPQPESLFVVQPTLFVGVKETTYRVALQGHYQPLQFPNGSVWVDWDVGEDFIKNAGHVAGVKKNEFEALGRIGVRVDLPR